VVCNLGRKDLLAPHIEALARLIKGEALPQVKPADMSAVGAWDWGVPLAARHLWEQLGLQSILDSAQKGEVHGDLSDRALALVANRLCEPTSEHGIARWLETDYVCDRSGRRWLPEWRNETERLASGRPRVRVKDRQLRQWYGTLDRLVAQKKSIEKELFLRLTSLFALNVDMVFYDLTSTCLEGNGPAGLALHEHSRDGKPRNRQILVGQVMIDGWPIAHHVFEGNKRDSMTVVHVLDDIQQRFGLGRVVFVGDRGMVTSDNIDLLRSREQGYVVGLNRQRRSEVLRYVERATGSWLDCPAGIAASERTGVPRTQVQEVQSDKPGVRVFVVHSDERLAYERTEREKAMAPVRVALDSLAQRANAGKLKAPEKIGAAAARTLARNHGYRYYDWKLEHGRFTYFEHPVKLQREKSLEGKYLIQTEEQNLSALEAVAVYMELSEVERAFARLKDVIEMRPIFHQKASRVQAHAFVASLAFLLDRAMDKKLKSAGLDISSREAWQILKTVRVVEVGFGDDKTARSVTQGSGRAANILKILGLKDLDPDTRKTGKRAA
jgi:transposase